MFFALALLVGFFGALTIFIGNDADKDKKIIACIILTAIYTLIGWWIFWGGLLSLAWPLFGGYGLVLFIWWVVSAIVAVIMSNGQWSNSFVLPIIYLVIVIIIAISGWGMFNSDKYASLIGNIEDKTQKHWAQDIQPLDPTHIRLVPKELALSLAKTTLSQDGATLGSQFPLDTNHITLQKIKGDYWYLIPLDFRSYNVWTNAKYVPGYVKISATDPYAKPILETGKKMKYTLNAYFGNNLERRLYWSYANKVLKDYSFEEDENGNVFWVITVCRPTIKYWGLVVEGVIIYNPETGDDKFVPKEEIQKDAQYDWVDRVMPVELAEDYIDMWGSYKDGWWNEFWKHINLLQAETPTMNYSSDGRCIFVSPVTSTNQNDQAMTGLMYTDARTGKSIYYATSGGATEEAIIGAVNSVVGYKKWNASDQIVYENVYGKLSALVPIIGTNGNYQGLAIVENENKRVAIGLNPQEALVEYQKLMMGSGGQITTENIRDVVEYTGKVSRIGWDMSSSGKQYYFYFPGFKHSFIMSSSLQSEICLTKEGDQIYMKYINSDQASIPVMYFKNLTLDLQASAREKSVNNQMLERKQNNQTKADVKDFKESVKEMSDEQVKQLIESQQKKKK